MGARILETVLQVSSDMHELENISKALVQQAMACRSTKHPALFIELTHVGRKLR